jgi:hypothetical protein
MGFSRLSTSCGHSVIGSLVRRKLKACPSSVLFPIGDYTVRVGRVMFWMQVHGLPATRSSFGRVIAVSESTGGRDGDHPEEVTHTNSPQFGIGTGTTHCPLSIPLCAPFILHS